MKEVLSSSVENISGEHRSESFEEGKKAIDSVVAKIFENEEYKKRALEITG